MSNYSKQSLECPNHPIPQGFSSFLLKPYMIAVAQFYEVEWWRPLMVECETIFRLFDPSLGNCLKLDLFKSVFIVVCLK